MSGPSWLPPRTLGSPERAIAPMSHTGPAVYRPPKKGVPDQRPKYSMYDQNGGTGGNSMPVRYMATGPSGKLFNIVYSFSSYAVLCSIKKNKE